MGVGGANEGGGEGGIGADGGGGMFSLPRLSSLTFLQLTEAIAAEPTNAAEKENRGVSARGETRGEDRRNRADEDEEGSDGDEEIGTRREWDEEVRDGCRVGRGGNRAGGVVRT